MEELLKGFIGNIRTGDIQAHDNLAIIPLFMAGNGGPSYITLKEALDKGILIITEIDTAGSVPELKVINNGNDNVILLDGEELSGAKQNRVLNTTVLIAAHSETIIPVSCTEHGRWSYTSSHFRDSDVVMAYNIKRNKARSVMENVRVHGRFVSNQGQVWDDIRDLSVRARVSSDTGAMKDVFESKEKDLDDYLKAITLVPGQKGMMVMINGELMGFDILSNASAYEKLHPKLLKSCAMEASLDRKKKAVDPAAGEFLKDIISCKYTKHPSVGLGHDLRFENENAVGTALVLEQHIIHMAFFTVTESDKAGSMAGLRQRRGNRMRH